MNEKIFSGIPVFVNELMKEVHVDNDELWRIENRE